MVDLAAGGYAAQQDLAGWVDTTPANAARLLRSASLRVAAACFRNPYTDEPSTGEAAALRDATCAQAAVWITSGIDPSDVGVSEAAIKRSSLLTGSVEYDTSTQARSREQAIAGLAPEAVAILTAAGLIWQPAPGVDQFAGGLPTFGLSGPRRGFPGAPWWGMDPVGPGELGGVIDTTDAAYPFLIEP